MFDDFPVSVKLPALADGEDKRVLYFPTTQICEEGKWEWISTPEEKSEEVTRGPAPTVTIYRDLYGVLGINETTAAEASSGSGIHGKFTISAQFLFLALTALYFVV